MPSSIMNILPDNIYIIFVHPTPIMIIILTWLIADFLQLIHTYYTYLVQCLLHMLPSSEHPNPCPPPPAPLPTPRTQSTSDHRRLPTHCQLPSVTAEQNHIAGTVLRGLCGSMSDELVVCRSFGRRSFGCRSSVIPPLLDLYM